MLTVAEMLREAHAQEPTQEERSREQAHVIWKHICARMLDAVHDGKEEYVCSFDGLDGLVISEVQNLAAAEGITMRRGAHKVFTFTWRPIEVARPTLDDPTRNIHPDKYGAS